ncbi:41830_t:CDS:2 [Gigaspora margarita]|uniref:41830_t:CDS:1 n=1 Tax=Gigaspora margarita TaxID=4874 RepID=A0ABM8W1G2_GIGMA|nr:41830_t:CDS:2 [Gigaspora margarita]
MYIANNNFTIEQLEKQVLEQFIFFLGQIQNNPLYVPSEAISFFKKVQKEVLE